MLFPFLKRHLFLWSGASQQNIRCSGAWLASILLSNILSWIYTVCTYNYTIWPWENSESYFEFVYDWKNIQYGRLCCTVFEVSNITFLVRQILIGRAKSILYAFLFWLVRDGIRPNQSNKTSGQFSFILLNVPTT